ncbi:MAG: hypothetical protein KGN39_09445, partial [Betaproteobacteria bacterium]|nr:hypothetical protein [Betaproteobacteria bacterium]
NLPIDWAELLASRVLLRCNNELCRSDFFCGRFALCIVKRITLRVKNLYYNQLVAIYNILLSGNRKIDNALHKNPLRGGRLLMIMIVH